ncbi:MAG: hypothetical protein Q4G04_06365 [bacterium]|nr:hypothetical protein [bacterium]
MQGEYINSNITTLTNGVILATGYNHENGKRDTILTFAKENNNSITGYDFLRFCIDEKIIYQVSEYNNNIIIIYSTNNNQFNKIIVIDAQTFKLINDNYNNTIEITSLSLTKKH